MTNPENRGGDCNCDFPPVLDCGGGLGRMILRRKLEAVPKKVTEKRDFYG
jgi:hypothetical protein